MNTLHPETVMHRSRCRLFPRYHPQMALQVQLVQLRFGLAVTHRQDLVNLGLHLLLVALIL